MNGVNGKNLRSYIKEVQIATAEMGDALKDLPKDDKTVQPARDAQKKLEDATKRAQAFLANGADLTGNSGVLPNTPGQVIENGDGSHTTR